MKIGVVGMAAGILLAFGAAGCSTGKPGFRTETMRPDQEHNFKILFRENCSGCHGDHGMSGAALPLNNSVYLTWAGHDRIFNIVANGVPHRLMPAFSAAGGGLLTNQQIGIIVDGMMSHWTRPGILNVANAPGYAPASAGNAALGKAAFQIYCARCHGADGKGATPNPDSTGTLAVGSIVDPTYLSLISTQGLRDIVVSGLPGQGMPDWRGDVAGKAMSDRDVTDVVAWLVSHRMQFPGQPFPDVEQH